MEFMRHSIQQAEGRDVHRLHGVCVEWQRYVEVALSAGVARHGLDRGTVIYRPLCEVVTRPLDELCVCSSIRQCRTKRILAVCDRLTFFTQSAVFGWIQISNRFMLGGPAPPCPPWRSHRLGQGDRLRWMGSWRAPGRLGPPCRTAHRNSHVQTQSASDCVEVKELGRAPLEPVG